MKYIIAFCLTCIFLCVGYSTKASQDSLFSVADSLQAMGNYKMAALEYERCVYKADNNIIKTKALLNKSECFKALKDFEEANKAISRINFAFLPDTLANQARYQGALYSYLAGDHATAESHLLQAETFISDSSLTYSSLFLYSLILNEQQRWKEAESKLIKLVKNSGLEAQKKDSLLNLVNAAYHPDNYPKFKNLNKAQRLSTFLPGTGQIYAGYPLEGIASAGIQVAALSFVVYQVVISHYVTAFTLGTGAFQMFYFGGINRVEYLVNKKNNELLRNHNDDLKQLILSINKSTE